MKRINWRIIIGSVLILGGLVSLLEKLGVFPPGIDIFWGIIGTAAGVAFLYVFFTNLHQQWWAAIPGFVLLGAGAAAFLPDSLNLDGLVFLGGIGVAFWAIYITNRQHWWAIIPGGVLLTLGIVAALSEGAATVVDSGGVFFLGLGLTFLLVALLEHHNWAFIPAAILMILGVAIGLQFESILDFVWIGALFLGGLIMIVFALRRRE